MIVNVASNVNSRYACSNTNCGNIIAALMIRWIWPAAWTHLRLDAHLIWMNRKEYSRSATRGVHGDSILTVFHLESNDIGSDDR